MFENRALRYCRASKTVNKKLYFFTERRQPEVLGHLMFICRRKWLPDIENGQNPS